MVEDETTARMLEALAAIDLSRADGRIGIGTLLARLEREAPETILRSAARVQLKALGSRLSPG